MQGSSDRKWLRHRLGNVADVLTGFPFKSERYTTKSTEPRLLRGDNIVQGSLRWDDAKHWTVGAAEALDAYWLCEGDVVLAMDRPWIEAGLKFACLGSRPCKIRFPLEAMLGVM